MNPLDNLPQALEALLNPDSFASACAYFKTQPHRDAIPVLVALLKQELAPETRQQALALLTQLNDHTARSARDPYGVFRL